MKNNFNSYDFFNFVVTAYHLCDWVEKVFSLKKGKILDNHREIKICRDLANASKHFGINPKHPSYEEHPPIVTHADTVSGFGHGRIVVTFHDPNTNYEEEVDGHEFVDKVVEAWENILRNRC